MVIIKRIGFKDNGLAKDESTENDLSTTWIMRTLLDNEENITSVSIG